MFAILGGGVVDFKPDVADDRGEVLTGELDIAEVDGFDDDDCDNDDDCEVVVCSVLANGVRSVEETIGVVGTFVAFVDDPGILTDVGIFIDGVVFVET